MSESETTEVTDQETKHENNSRKRVRHRKKQLYENILKQMEFYFSDANLTKDRFLGDLVKNDPYVPLDTFLKCNKIRSITQDVNDIAKAMKNSSFLELSEDKTKVRRKTPVMPYDADQRTIYVESIPVTASRDWLQRVFSDYGQVAYISLPSFKNSQRIKGFGFIEFSKPEEAQKCLNAFTKMGCKLPTCMPPEELSSIRMFSIPEESVEGQQESKEEKEEEPPKKKKKTKEKKPKQLELKPSQESDCEKQEKRTDEKKSTPTEASFQEETKSITTPTEEMKTPDTESKEELTSQDEGKTDATPRKKKTRKRTAKERSQAKNSLGPNEAPKGALWGLQVLPKSEWKLLRNKYLNLQRKYMKELKANLQNKRHAYSSIPAPAAPSAELEPVIVPQEAEGTKSVGPLERVPGVFVKEVLSEPCLDVRLTKRTIRTNIHVLHVDAKEGQSEVVIRFDSPKSAEEYCTQSSNRAQVITGAEENDQWSRAEAARSHKRARGRARILARGQALDTGAAVAPASPQPTSTHIRFDE